MPLPRRSWEWALSWQIYLRILKPWAGQWLNIETTYNVNNLYYIFIGGPIPAALDLLSPPFFPSFPLSGSGIRIILKDGLSVRQLYGSPLLSVLLLSISCPKVCRILMSQFSVLFFFVLSQPASICIIIIPNSLTHLFFSFSLHPKHILFFLSLSNHTHSYTIHPTPSLLSPLTTPPFPCYDPLLIHLCALDISYAHLVSKLSPRFNNSL